MIYTCLYEAKNVNNLFDRIIILFNLFYRLISIFVNNPNCLEKESLILSLFNQEWFVILINKTQLDERESHFRHDFFMCLIEALFYTKAKILKRFQLNNFINLIKICLEIIDLCFKMIEWQDEGEAYKMYFLVLEETCLFFDDTFFCFLYDQNTEFVEMKQRLDGVLVSLAKRFSNKIWAQLAFSNENSKYRSLLLLSQFLPIDNTENINLILEVIFLRMNDISIDKRNEKYVEQILKSCLFLGIRVLGRSREKIISNLSDFVDKIKTKHEIEPVILNNVLSFSENLLNYLLVHKNDPQLVLDSKIIDKLNNEFFLIVQKEIDKKPPNNYKKPTLINLYLLNLAVNSYTVLSDSKEESSSTYLENFRKFYYYPLLEFNNDFCYVLIDSKIKTSFSNWKLVTGISDPIHIYYMYKLNLENREVELFIKSYNTTSVVLNNLVFKVFLSKNLQCFRKSLINRNCINFTTQYNTLSKDFTLDMLSPYSHYEFSLIYFIQNFDKNNISIDCTFDMATTISKEMTISTDLLYVPLCSFFIPDNFALYDSKKFDIFYSTLEYTFTVKCYAFCTPEEFLIKLNKNFVMIEFKSKVNSIEKSKSIIEKYKEINYKDLFQQNTTKDLNKESQRYNFKLKLASYSVFNFWIYLVIIGDYNHSNKKSILNIEVKCNDLTALHIIFREKNLFFSELTNKLVKFY